MKSPKNFNLKLLGLFDLYTNEHIFFIIPNLKNLHIIIVSTDFWNSIPKSDKSILRKICNLLIRKCLQQWHRY